MRLDVCRSWLLRVFHNPKYIYLLLSLLALIVVAPVAGPEQQYHVLVEVAYGLVCLLGPFYSSKTIRGFLGHVLLGMTIFTLFVLHVGNGVGAIVSILLTLAFFSLLLKKVLIFILREKEVTVNSIFASISGYLILGITAAPLMQIIELSSPGAFVLPVDYQFFDFIYFSFITLTSVGFGDIIPSVPGSKATVIILSLAGQLYLTIVMALIIGKFLARRNDQ